MGLNQYNILSCVTVSDYYLTPAIVKSLMRDGAYGFNEVMTCFFKKTL